MFSLAITFFLITNPIGNSPAIIALIKDFPFDRQKKIIFREGMFALLLALFFQYLGEIFLSMLNIQDYSVTMTGGFLIFLVSLGMIFSKVKDPNEKEASKQEPYLVPIATPILSGPGLLAIVMLKTKIVGDNFTITSAILLAWVGIMAVLMAAPYLQKVLGPRGLVALEQIMGMVLSFIGIDMMIKGTALLMQSLQ